MQIIQRRFPRHQLSLDQVSATPASDEAQQSPEPDGDIEIIGDDPMGINVDLPEPQPLEAEEVDVPDADREVEPPVEGSKGSSSNVHDDGAHKRSLGEKELKEEAKSIRHMLTHIPKNPFLRHMYQS